MRCVIAGVITGLGLLGLFLSSVEYVNAASFMGLGDRPGGTFLSEAFSISTDGTTIVGRSFSALGSEAFRWTASEGMVGLGDLPGGNFFSQAEGVSADGTVVVGRSSSVSGTEAFRWTASEGMVGLGILPGGIGSGARAVSADGTVVVGDGGYEAFRWTTSDGMRGLGFLPGGAHISTAYAVSADGTIVVGEGNSAFGEEAFRWTASEGMVGLGDLPGAGFSSEARGISADGMVIVGVGSSASGPAFRWTASEGMVSLGDLPGGNFSSEALAVSADGTVIVGWGETSPGVREAFIWNPIRGMRRLSDVLSTQSGLAAALTGWTLIVATGISGDGLTISGYGINPSGDREAWIAQLDALEPDNDNDTISDGEDVCPDTVIPEPVPTERLGVNRFALTNPDGIFDTVAPRGKGPQKVFTIADTAGCSCEQIIDALGLGKGHKKFGCSISTMEDWIAGLLPPQPHGDNDDNDRDNHKEKEKGKNEASDDWQHGKQKD